MSESLLPIINSSIPIAGFYLTAPLILVGLYFYLHLYLQRLWQGLSTLPAVFPDGKPVDEKIYPWFLNGLVRAHFERLKPEQRPLSRLENLLSVLLAWWIVPFTLLCFWLRYIPRHDWWGTGLHIALITVAWMFAVRSYRLAIRTLSGARLSEEKRDDRLWVRVWHTIRRYLPDKWITCVLMITVALSLSAAINPARPTERGTSLAAYLFSVIGYRTAADLRDAEISIKPPNWTGQEKTAEVELAQVKGADLRHRDLRYSAASGSFLVKARLEKSDLRGADLSQADLRRANLSGADLRGATLRGAKLEDACKDDETKLPQEVAIESCPGG